MMPCYLIMRGLVSCRCTLCRRTLHNLALDLCDNVPSAAIRAVSRLQRPVGDGVVRLRRGKCVRRRCVREQQVVLLRAEANARQIWLTQILVASRNSPTWVAISREASDA